jgi:hypothetical protein
MSKIMPYSSPAHCSSLLMIRFLPVNIQGMCTHALSGNEITGRITNELYPFIDDQIRAVVLYIQQSVLCTEATVLFDLFYKLKTNFTSLKEDNIYIVFPAVLSLFDTKDKAGAKPDVQIDALQQSTLEKERALMQLIADIEQEAELLQLPEGHVVFRLIAAFKTQFSNSKQEWNLMLQGWNRSCACFSAAQLPAPQKTKNTGIPENR